MLFWKLYGIILAGISINLERNAFKGEKSRIVSSGRIFPSFLRYKEVTDGRGQIGLARLYNRA
jgi:hypothetical protein